LPMNLIVRFGLTRSIKKVSEPGTIIGVKTPIVGELPIIYH